MSAGDPALLNEGLVGVEAIGSGASETGAGADSQPCREVWTPNQIVAYRVARARQLRGWTQVEAARQLEPFLGVRLSPASFSAIERSVLGGRIRRFSGDEIVALARGFGVPLGWFFTPPPRSQLVSVQTPDAARDGLDPLELIDLALGDPTSLAEWQRALTEFSWDSRPTAGPPGDVPGCPDRRVPERLHDLIRLRTRTRLGEVFGDTEAATAVLTALLRTLLQIEDDPEVEVSSDDLAHGGANTATSIEGAPILARAVSPRRSAQQDDR